MVATNALTIATMSAGSELVYGDVDIGGGQTCMAASRAFSS